MKATIQPIIPSLAFLLIGMTTFFVLGQVSLPPIFAGRLMSGIVLSLLLFILSAAFLRFDRNLLRQFHLIPNLTSINRLIAGLFIGALIAGAMIGALFIFTDLSIARIQEVSLMAFVVSTLAIIPLALMEELLFRGYPLFKLFNDLNPRWAILMTSVLFGLYHYNDSQTIFGVLMGPGVWGVVFALAAYISKSIAVPLGIHISANLLQSVFGLKTHYSSLWSIENIESVNLASINNFGLAMQVILLILALVVMEWFLRQKK